MLGCLIGLMAKNSFANATSGNLDDFFTAFLFITIS